MSAISKSPANNIAAQFDAQRRLNKHNLQTAADRSEFKSNHEISQAALKLANEQFLAQQGTGGKLDVVG